MTIETRSLIKCAIVAIGTVLFFAVSAYRIRRASRKDTPLTRYLRERESKQWIDQHNKRRAV